MVSFSVEKELHIRGEINGGTSCSQISTNLSLLKQFPVYRSEKIDRAQPNVKRGLKIHKNFAGKEKNR